MRGMRGSTPSVSVARTVTMPSIVQRGAGASSTPIGPSAATGGSARHVLEHRGRAVGVGAGVGGLHRAVPLPRQGYVDRRARPARRPGRAPSRRRRPTGAWRRRRRPPRPAVRRRTAPGPPAAAGSRRARAPARSAACPTPAQAARCVGGAEAQRRRQQDRALRRPGRSRASGPGRCRRTSRAATRAAGRANSAYSMAAATSNRSPAAVVEAALAGALHARGAPGVEAQHRQAGQRGQPERRLAEHVAVHHPAVGRAAGAGRPAWPPGPGPAAGPARRPGRARRRCAG